MSFGSNSDAYHYNGHEEPIANMTGGNRAVIKWTHTTDETDFDDGAAFAIIRGAILDQNNDPRRLRRVAAELAALLPTWRPSGHVLASLWSLFVSLAQQTPSENVAMLDLVVILDHLSSSPRTTAKVTVDGFEQLSSLDGLKERTRESIASPYLSSNRTKTLTRWINLNAFAALLWSYNLVDGRDFAIQQLRAAFEDRCSSDTGDRDAADARIMAAAQWAIHSCQRLYHLSVTSEATSPIEGQGAKGSNGNGNEKHVSEDEWKPGARFKGRGGFSFRRWEFWQQGFEEAHEFGNGGVESKAEAGAAAGMMEKVMYAGFEI